MKRLNRLFAVPVTTLILAVLSISRASIPDPVGVNHAGAKIPSLAIPAAARGEKTGHRLEQENLDDSLAAAYQAALYGIERDGGPGVQSESLWHADNSAQEMEVAFTPATVRVGTTESGAVHRDLTLQLTGYGYAGKLQSPARVEPKTNGNHITYDRGAMTEWYINAPNGLEQGFTLKQQPATVKTGSLVLTLGIETDLQARADDENNRVEFVDSADQVRFRYSELNAWDAAGRRLPAKMRADDEQIALLIDDSQATYPVTIDPLIFTETKLMANDAVSGDVFGGSVAISGDTAVVGASGKFSSTGAAYVFVRSGGVWSQQQKLTASDAAPLDRFGFSVAISGDTAVVGAPGKFAELVGRVGAAYVFVRSSGVWTQQQKLTASDAATGDEFGYSVAISGDTAVIGAPNKLLSCAPLGACFDAGAAYVFERSSGVWSQPQELTASIRFEDAEFGLSVAISGDTAVIGAPGDLGVSVKAGAAYVFVRSGGVWSPQQKLKASDGATDDAFGYSVAISGDTAVVGARGKSSSTGAAYVFARSSGVWGQQQKLTASDAATSDEFGYSVAISGDTAVVGARSKSSFTGAAYVFVRTGVAWTEEAKLTASDAATEDLFGQSVAISGDTAVVGASFKSSSTGAAYVYVNTTAADLLVSLGEDQTSVKQGDTLTYTITVKNFGPNRAVNTLVNDTLSGGTGFLAASANKGSFTAPPGGQTGTVTWYLGEMLPSDQEDAQIQVTVIVRGKTTITNTAIVQSDSKDPNLVNNTASIITTVAPGGGKK